jgi:hypothetical protein
MQSGTPCESIRQAVLCVAPSEVRPLVGIRSLVVCFERLAPYRIFCVLLLLIVYLGLCEILLLYFFINVIALIDLGKVWGLPLRVAPSWLVRLTDCNRHLELPSVDYLSIIMIDSPLSPQMILETDC